MMMMERTTTLLFWLLLLVQSHARFSTATAFIIQKERPFATHRRRHIPADAAVDNIIRPLVVTNNPSSTRRFPSSPISSTTARYMVFDFFKQRTQEGLEQLNNLASASYQGQLTQGIQNAFQYTQQTNEKFYQGLSSSRTQLLQNLDNLFGSGGFWSALSGNKNNNPTEEWLENLLNVLLQADLGMSTSEDIIQEVRSFLVLEQTTPTTEQPQLTTSASQSPSSAASLTQADLLSILRGKLIEALETGQSRRIAFSSTTDDSSHKLPTVLFIMGANGMGKTTTIGKLAHRLRTEGNQKVLLAACDTFRAGAVAQLAQWADRAQVDVCGPEPMMDPTSTTTTAATSPSAVLYSALDKAIAEQYDTVLVDTSGRLSNNDALTAELAKMKRVIQKRLSVETDPATGKALPNVHVPHETLLVMDAAQGRMALDAAKVWHEEIGVTGLILTKLDGSARGGSVVAVSRELKLPVKLIGVGEGMDDLRDFEPESFVDGLLGIGAAGGSSTSSSNDGSLLASRLEEMRKDRDARAAASLTQQKATPKRVYEPTLATADNQLAAAEAPSLQQVQSTPSKSKGKASSSRSKKSKKGKR